MCLLHVSLLLHPHFNEVLIILITFVSTLKYLHCVKRSPKILIHRGFTDLTAWQAVLNLWVICSIGIIQDSVLSTYIPRSSVSSFIS